MRSASRAIAIWNLTAWLTSLSLEATRPLYFTSLHTPHQKHHNMWTAQQTKPMPMAASMAYTWRLTFNVRRPTSDVRCPTTLLLLFDVLSLIGTLDDVAWWQCCCWCYHFAVARHFIRVVALINAVSNTQTLLIYISTFLFLFFST